MLKYFLEQLTQMCTWFGIAVILSALFLPRMDIAILGAIMIFLHDEAIKAFIAKRAPGLSKWIQDIVEDI